jgi:hypothetical protein
MRASPGPGEKQQPHLPPSQCPHQTDLNDGRIPNSRGVRVARGTGYNRVEGNRRASRNGRVSDLPPELPNVTIRHLVNAPPRAPAQVKVPRGHEVDGVVHVRLVGAQRGRRAPLAERRVELVAQHLLHHRLGVVDAVVRVQPRVPARRLGSLCVCVCVCVC